MDMLVVRRKGDPLIKITIPGMNVTYAELQEVPHRDNGEIYELGFPVESPVPQGKMTIDRLKLK